MRQLVYTTFISNNRTSFHSWWKKNLVKHLKVSKHYETDCRRFFSYHWSIAVFIYFAKFYFKVLKFFLQQFFKFNQNIYTSSSLFYLSKLYKLLDFKNHFCTFWSIIKWQSFSKNSEMATSLTTTLFATFFVKQLFFLKNHIMNFFIDFLIIFPMIRVTHLFKADFFFLVTLHEI